MDPPGGIWAHICGSDLIRDADGTVYVLEDNLRVPSGVSYLLENRMVAKHVFPELFRHYSIEPVDPYVGRLAGTAGLGLPVHRGPDHRGADAGDLQLGLLRARLPGPAARGGAGRGRRPGRPRRRLRLRPDHRRPPAGRRHLPADRRPLPRPRGVPARLACSGCPGSCGPGGRVGWPWSTRPGPASPTTRRSTPTFPTSSASSSTRSRSWPPWPPSGAATRSPAASSSGTWPSWWSSRPTSPAGTACWSGPQATAGELADAAKQIEAEPTRWVAQPVIPLSTAPTLCDGEIAPRHVDLRPFTLLGPEGAYVTRGGLTRVARRAGSLVVNSSQGGGSKDTWVVDTGEPTRPEARAPTGAGLARGHRAARMHDRRPDDRPRRPA